MSFTKNAAAQVALATAIGLGSAVAPMTADAGITEQAINSPSTSGQNVSVQSLKTSYDNYKRSSTARDAQARAIADAAAKAGGASGNPLAEFMNAAKGIKSQPIDPQKAQALGLPTGKGAFPFPEEDAARAIDMLTSGQQVGGRSVMVVTLTGNDGKKYNIVGEKFKSSRPIVSLEQAMSGTQNMAAGAAPRTGYATDNPVTRTGLTGTTDGSNNALNASTDVTTRAANARVRPGEQEDPRAGQVNTGANR